MSSKRSRYAINGGVAPNGRVAPRQPHASPDWDYVRGISADGKPCHVFVKLAGRSCRADLNCLNREEHTHCEDNRCDNADCEDHNRKGG